MTDPTPDPLAEALTAVLHDYYTVLPKLYVDVAHRIVTTTLAARGVYLVTEESLAKALPLVALALWSRSEGGDHHTVWFDEDVLRHFTEWAPDTAAAILRSLGEASDDR